MNYYIKISGVTKQKSLNSAKVRKNQNERVWVVAPDGLSKAELTPYVYAQIGYVEGFTILNNANHPQQTPPVSI